MVSGPRSFLGGGLPPCHVTGPIKSPVPSFAKWRGGTLVRRGYPYPHTWTGEQVMFCRGWYASCGHAGGLSCPLECLFTRNVSTPGVILCR